uniref:Interleukin-12 receptor subunit beta-2 n=1 Tax=Oreochromis niloticus TaxID=8128 RepID=A0A669F5H4_ORENI
MATPITRWLLSILVTSVSAAAADPPAPPSNLKCFRPCDETNCHVDIQCTWDPKSDPKIPTNYTLHWKPTNNHNGHVKGGTSLDGRIPRKDFSGGEKLRVWVEAVNQNGSNKSRPVVFNVEEITKPLPPKDITAEQEPLEFMWSTSCIESSQSCDIRYRTKGETDWPKFENETHGSYAVEEPDPFTVYEFQVRCACGGRLMSDWSKIHSVRSAESDPVGEVDLWRDCGISPISSDCFLTWKSLSDSQARGFIHGYNLTIFYSNGSELQMSTAEPNRQYVHEIVEQLCSNGTTKWFLNATLKDVSSVSIFAYSSQGATDQSFLTISTTGKEENAVKVGLEMNKENLTVSWGPPSDVSELKEYVVQYKQAGSPPGREFDWIRVNKSQNTAFFKVLLAVPSFKVETLLETEVTLHWKPIPLSEQTARIWCYEIGYKWLDTQKVFNVNASNDHQTFTLRDLSPGNYEVWMRAITDFGHEVNATETFKLNHQQDIGLLIPVLSAVVLLCVCIGCISLSVCPGPIKACPLISSCVSEKVPDPRNSHIFKQMKHQFNDPLGWICIPVCEPQPMISVLEVVKIKSPNLDPDGLTGPLTGDKFSQDDQREDAVPEESGRLDRRYGKEPYSKMVDSDEETSGSSSEEEQFTSGYEQHFMPSPLEFNESLDFICIPVSETQPKNSEGLIGPVAGDECSEMESQDDQREGGREVYNKMDDFYEETGDFCSSSEEEQFTSGYEKHFMPSPLEVL